MNKTKGVGKKFIALLFCANIIMQSMVATISGMFKIGDSAKTVISSLLFTQLDYAELVIFVLRSLLIM